METRKSWMNFQQRGFPVRCVRWCEPRYFGFSRGRQTMSITHDTSRDPPNFERGEKGFFCGPLVHVSSRYLACVFPLCLDGAVSCSNGPLESGG